ncbi:MAG TPA: hypothetical protein VFT87_01840, partial [Candidatus Saccharimonadales bacterium]|nr:hypothetical protein [Candidatus Saccharimonadales bacterium]
MHPEHPERPMANKVSPLQIAGGFFTFIGTAVGLLATDKPELVIGGCILGAIALLVLAGLVWRKNDKKAAAWLIAGSAAFVVGLVLYVNFIQLQPAAPDDGKQLGVTSQPPPPT